MYGWSISDNLVIPISLREVRGQTVLFTPDLTATLMADLVVWDSQLRQWALPLIGIVAWDYSYLFLSKSCQLIRSKFST